MGEEMIIDEPNFKSIGEFLKAITVIGIVIFAFIWIIGGLFSSKPTPEVPDYYWNELER